MSTIFTPYWHPVTEAAGPLSWVFFVVADIGGQSRPVAVASALGIPFADEDLQGYPLTAVCQRLVTIYSDQANHGAIQTELSLAAELYHARDAAGGVPPVVLPELDRTSGDAARRTRPWDRHLVCEFPFTTVCLVQGVGLDANGNTHSVRTEPLATVYHDTSIEWGMVVIDISSLDAVRYGIVGFTVQRGDWISSRKEQQVHENRALVGAGVFHPSHLRVIEEIRSRQAMSATEYMAKFGYPMPEDVEIGKLLAAIPVVESRSMELVWPSNTKGNDLLAASSAPSAQRSSHGEMETETETEPVLEVLGKEELDTAWLERLQAGTHHKSRLRQKLTQHSAKLGNTRAAGQLLRLGFAQNEHLGLELLGNLRVEAVLAAINMPGMSEIASLSLCVGKSRDTPKQVIDALSQADSVREIFLFQDTTRRRNDDFNVQLIQGLMADVHLLQRAKMVLSNAYSTTLCQRFWLPTVSIPRRNDDAVQTAPLDVFPVQQVLVRRQTSSANSSTFHHSYIHVADALLKPERFASGLMLYLRSLIAAFPEAGANHPPGRLFSFSSAPSSLAADPLHSAEVSPLLAENWSLQTEPQQKQPAGTTITTTAQPLWPRMRDLVPQGWTVLVSQAIDYNRAMAQHNTLYMHAPAFNRPHRAQYLQYAFVRPVRRRITVIDDDDKDREAHSILKPEDLEVVGLSQFLRITAPEVDDAVVESQLRKLEQQVLAGPKQGSLPLGIEPLSVFSPGEAAEVLEAFIQEAAEVNKRLRAAMNEFIEGRNWYPELCNRLSNVSLDVICDSSDLQRDISTGEEWWE